MARGTLYLLTLTTICLNICDSDKILAIIPSASYSHQIVFRPLWKTLSQRGHQLTVLTTDPLNDPTLTNLTEIDLSLAYEVSNRYNIKDKINDHKVMEHIEFFLNMYHEIIDQELSHPEVKNLIQDKSVQFDLAFIELFLPTMVAFRHRFKCPLIGITTMDAHIAVQDVLGNPTHPVLYPDFFLPFSSDLNFIERVVSVLYSISFRIMSRLQLLPAEDMTVKKHFGEDYPSLEEMFSNVDMAFFNVNPLFHIVRPTVPSVVLIGGGFHIREERPLPENIKAYLDQADEGVVYFSLGSNVKSKDIPFSTRKNIKEALSELPYKVLWKFEEGYMEDKPTNVKIMKWLPQQDVLGHPNIKAFITQGGLQSIEESIHHGIPMIVMPYFADQLSNAKLIVQKQIGLSVDHQTLEKEDFRNIISEVVENSTYRNNTRKLSKLMYDQPMTGLEKAVWWTEYVLRHKGAKHLRSPAIDLPLYQYFLLDIMAFCAGIAALTSLLVYKLYKFINCSCKSRRSHNKKQKVQ